jgi:hypothetical protein
MANSGQYSAIKEQNMNKKTMIFMAVVFVLAAGFVNSTNEIIKSMGMVKPTGPFRPIRLTEDNVYFTIYNTETGQVWNENGSVFVDTDDASVTGGNYGNIAITATDLRAQAEDGWMPVIPSAIKDIDSTFQADLLFYDNGTPAATDAILLGRHCYIKATKVGGIYASRIWTIDDL